MVSEQEAVEYEENRNRRKNMTDINKMENGPMLNLYPDSLGGDLEVVADLFERDGFADAFSSIYILPSIYHSDLDRGFSVIDYDLEETFHSEKALLRLGRQNIDLKLDFVLNHASVQSPQFQDLLENGSQSEYRDFLLTGMHSGKLRRNDRRRLYTTGSEVSGSDVLPQTGITSVDG